MNHTTDIVISPPTVEPLSRTQAKLHLKSTTAAEDALVDAMIAAARGHAEKFCSRALVLQTRRLLLDEFPWCIKLEWGPVRAVQSVQYLDEAGNLQTLAADQYVVDKHSLLARIKRQPEVSWPSTRQVPNAVIVTYTAGMLVPFTANPATDVLTAAGHGFADADITQAVTIGGTLPTGLVASTNYHVRDATADTLKLAAAAGGAAIDITAAGTPPNALGRMDKEVEQALQLLVQYFEQRDASEHILAAAEALLWPFRLVLV